jgi:ankyrin repeat protein
VLRKHRERIESEAQTEEEDPGEFYDEEEEEEVEEVEKAPVNVKDGMTALHVAASDGDLDTVVLILSSFESGSVSGSDNYDMLHARDANDWQAIHEAATAGHLEVLKYLVDKGADVGAMTKEGGSVLWWAKKSLEKDDPVIAYLEEIGAPDLQSEPEE